MLLIIAPMAIIYLAIAVLHFWALIEVLRTPVSIWQAADQNQVLWGVVVLFLPLFGPTLYAIIARPQIQAAEGAVRD